MGDGGQAAGEARSMHDFASCSTGGRVRGPGSDVGCASVGALCPQQLAPSAAPHLGLRTRSGQAEAKTGRPVHSRRAPFRSAC
jgi:hypothetical protein